MMPQLAKRKGLERRAAFPHPQGVSSGFLFAMGASRLAAVKAGGDLAGMER
jgi:hypothetical protein